MAKILSLGDKRIISALLIGLALFFFAPTVSQAADFQVSPMLQELQINQEQTMSSSVVLTNTTELPMTFSVKVIDFGSLDESGGTAFLGERKDLNERYRLASWMHAADEVITIASGAEKKVDFTIENNSDLAPGGHYGALVFQQLVNTDDVDRNAIAITQMVASLVVVKKIGGAEPALTLDHAASVWHWRQPPEVTLTFHNPGNIHVVPRGIVSLEDPMGRSVARGIINDGSGLVLPDTNRSLIVKPFWVVTAWLPGRYILKINYRYDGREDFLVSSLPIFLIPPIFCLGMSIFLLMGGVGYWYYRRFNRTSP